MRSIRTILVGMIVLAAAAIAAVTVVFPHAEASHGDLLITPRPDAAETRRLAELVPVFPGSKEVGYRDLGWSRANPSCHGRSGELTLRGQINVVWDVTQWYDRTLPPRGWRIFGGFNSRSAAPAPGQVAPDSFVEHGYITDRQSIGVHLPADLNAHPPKDAAGETTWSIHYQVMDGDAQTVPWCAFQQIGSLGT